MILCNFVVAFYPVTVRVKTVAFRQRDVEVMKGKHGP